MRPQSLSPDSSTNSTSELFKFVKVGMALSPVGGSRQQARTLRQAMGRTLKEDRVNAAPSEGAGVLSSGGWSGKDFPIK